ncbi:MAG: hypothetical protein L6R42_003045 [Xanthoria sp. 1 TBL-2021]|nr:MAG: hypothetical protein L6R42_003045 [Xanthoria sp. 1 TBL-2021]
MEVVKSNCFGKRLIVACDGTWMNSDNGFEKDSYLPWDHNGHLQVPSNVTRICRAIRPMSQDGRAQIIYYQAGVGTEESWWDHVYGGGTGAGLSENIREAYAFLAANYQPGDQIILFGFSRGAFTARSIAAMISSVGLLTVEGMVEFYAIFKDWEHQADVKYKSRWPDRPFPNKPSVTDPAYAEELELRGLTRRNISISAIGVWDTVGALGIPDVGLIPRKPTDYSFIDTKVSPNIEHAFQALALDEYRKPFGPTLWHKPEGQKNPITLKQCWFPGVHSNVGGSYEDTGLADITLVWMIAQMFPFLDFDLEYIETQRRLTTNYYREQGLPVRSLGMGKIYNSMAGIERIAGKKVRTPGHYYVVDPTTGKTVGKEILKRTEESIHSSVRLRKELGGPGPEDKSAYVPVSLAKWDILGNPRDQNVRWAHKHLGEQQLVIPEDEMSEIELQLLALSPRSTTVLTEGLIKRAATLKSSP